jgi:hypothetical protein
MIMSLSLPARLLRAFAVDFLTAHETAAVERIMDPAYRLSIGGHVFDGRDGSYLPVTAAQLDQFPGLCVTCHDVVLSPDAVAMRFTEHGVSVREARASSWGGVTVFRIEGGRLRHGWAEEDYFARKRQLKSGVGDAILPPHPAPWDQPVLAPNQETEAVLRAWLGDPRWILEGIEEISAEGPRLTELVTPTSIEVNTLFSAGPRAAFHAVVMGSYRGGFPDIDPAKEGTASVLRIAGIADIIDGAAARIQVCGDRLGLHRQLLGTK